MNKAVSMRLIPLPRLASNGRWRVEAMRSLSEPCILCFTKGMGRITVAGVTRGYAAGTIVYVPAGFMHGFEVGPQVLGWALFLGRDCAVQLPDSPQHIRLSDIVAQQEMTMMLDMVARELDTGTPAALRAAMHYVGLLSVWLERKAEAAGVTAQRPDAAQRLVARFTQVMENAFRSGAGVGDIAAELGVTPTHLTRCCRAASGRSAIELLQDRRLFEARQLLAETKLPVGQISAALGFTSAAYFTRAFQNQTGVSPSMFRKSA
jgi:AraC family transcriptional activator of pobA